MNFKDESIKNMYLALKEFCSCGIIEKGKIIKCKPNDEDFVRAWKAIEQAEREMPWLVKIN